MLKCAGVMWIQDPHVTRRNPESRVGSSIFSSAMMKLRYCLELAKENNYQVIIGGDLVDKEVEPEIAADLIELLIDHKPFVLLSNHDASGATLANGSTLKILASARCINLLMGVGKSFSAEVSGKACTFWHVDAFHQIPDRIEGEEGVNILSTHHGLAFDPLHERFGWARPFEIQGVEHVVNGHIHENYASVKSGETCWHNPGNVTRMTSTERGNVPGFYLFDGERFTRHAIPHVETVFAESNQPRTLATPMIIADLTSEFVEQCHALAPASAVLHDDKAFGKLLDDASEGLGLLEEEHVLLSILHTEACRRVGA